MYIKQGSYGKARSINTKFVDLLEKYNDDKTDACDAGIQTDPFPFLGPQATWSTSSYGPTAVMNEPYASESIPPVTTEQTLLTLDIVSVIRGQLHGFVLNVISVTISWIWRQFLRVRKSCLPKLNSMDCCAQ